MESRSDKVTMWPCGPRSRRQLCREWNRPRWNPSKGLGALKLEYGDWGAIKVWRVDGLFSTAE